MSKQLERVCAWCQREQGEQPSAGQTHGICDCHCAEVAKEGLRERYVVLPARSDLAYSRTHELGRALRDLEEWNRMRSNVRRWGRASILDTWNWSVLTEEQLRSWAGLWDSKALGGS